MINFIRERIFGIHPKAPLILEGTLCIRCESPAEEQWWPALCSVPNEKRRWIPLCTICDIALNTMVARFLYGEESESFLEEYRQEKLG
jgi:hypothetical protein